MKKTELEKIRELNETELDKKLRDLKEELFNLRFQHAINQLDNPMRLKAVKKEIAESWPNSLDDTCAREEWGWKPEWDLSRMTDDMLEHIRAKVAAK